jgi:hypothetical protein
MNYSNLPLNLPERTRELSDKGFGVLVGALFYEQEWGDLIRGKWTIRHWRALPRYSPAGLKNLKEHGFVTEDLQLVPWEDGQ